MTDSSITIACPSCAFCKDYPFERLPPKTVSVTCPKCNQKFHFSEHVPLLAAATKSNLSEKSRDIAKAVAPSFKAPPTPFVSPSKGKETPHATIPIARQKPKAWLVVAGAVVLSGSSVFLFAVGDYASGCFPLFLALLIAGTYLYYKRNPHLEDTEYLRTTSAAIFRTVLRHGHASQKDIDAIKEAEENARKRYARTQTSQRDSTNARTDKKLE